MTAERVQPGSGMAGYFELQWSRGRMTAESERAAQASRPASRGFNGAAVG